MSFLSEITGSFAQPCAENPTVAMIEAAYRHHGMNWRYLNCEVAPHQLAAAVAGARAMNWAGFNCSLPHKVSVIPHLDGLGESARHIGAVNCVVRRGESYIGENTDGKGFLQSLRAVADPSGWNVVVLGAGGASRAVSVELALAGVQQITVVNRSEDRARGLVETLQRVGSVRVDWRSWDQPFAVPPATQLVVNTTSMGLFPDVEACPALIWESLEPDTLVADVVFNPPVTRFLRAAQTRGCRTLDGLGMLVNQGVIGVKYWSGVDVNADVMKACLSKIFEVGAGD